MALPKYTVKSRHEMAALLGIDEQYLYQILQKIKTPSASLAVRFNQLDQKAKLQDLRPNDWKQIWPNLLKNSSKKVENRNVQFHTL